MSESQVSYPLDHIVSVKFLVAKIPNQTRYLINLKVLRSPNWAFYAFFTRQSYKIGNVSRNGNTHSLLFDRVNPTLIALWIFVSSDVVGHHVDFCNGGRCHCGLMLILRFFNTWSVASHFYYLAGNRVEIEWKFLCWYIYGSQLIITVVTN
jgi:hypothetical protein